MARWYFSTRKLKQDSSPAATRSITAASLAGSRPAWEPALGSGLESGREAVPAPRAELSRTRVAISSGTPSAPEGCAPCVFSCPVSALEFPVEAPFFGEPVLAPANRAVKCAEPAFPRPEPLRPAPANSTPPRPGTGRSAASPSGGKSAAWRIDLALQRMVGRGPGLTPMESKGLAESPAGVTLTHGMPRWRGHCQPSLGRLTQR